jgi:competence protein ComEA
MERSRRFILFLAAAILLSIPLIKGRGPSDSDGSVAFLPYTARGVMVKVMGDVASRGIYAFDEAADAAYVIKMTESIKSSQMPDQHISGARIRHGDLVEITRMSSQPVEIVMKSMRARERMLLGIPLDPDQMDADDWRCLPGIGPALAQRILIDRQENGDFGSLEAVLRVHGIGEKKLDKLRKYFN